MGGSWCLTLSWSSKREDFPSIYEDFLGPVNDWSDHLTTLRTRQCTSRPQPPILLPSRISPRRHLPSSCYACDSYWLSQVPSPAIVYGQRQSMGQWLGAQSNHAWIISGRYTSRLESLRYGEANIFFQLVLATFVLVLGAEDT